MPSATSRAQSWHVANFHPDRIMDLLSTDDVATIAALETGTSSFFDHRDRGRVKWLSTRALDV